MTNERVKSALADHYQDIESNNAEKKHRRAQSKEQRAFDKLPEQTMHEFWCGECQIDFVAPAYKVWSEIHQCGSWHSFCPVCERVVVRYATSRTLDPYYEQSVKIKVMRSEHETDMLRPGEYGFNMLYGDPFEGYYRRFQQRDEDIHNRYAALGLTGMTLDMKGEQERLQEEMSGIV